eukprot:gene11252-15097_t
MAYFKTIFSFGFLFVNSSSFGWKSPNCWSTRLMMTTKNTDHPKCYLDDSDRPHLIGNKPDSLLNLAKVNFLKELRGIAKTTTDQTVNINRLKDELPTSLKLKLTNDAVKQTELTREEKFGRVEAHPIARSLYDAGCTAIDYLFDNRPIERFWFLETVARMPYFVCVSMLHLYESFGWLRAPSLRKVHEAEEWNELHHLLIMESLGGDKNWFDRFMGYHSAIAAYWLLIGTYLYSPQIAYQFMELLETHAVDTYGTFVEENVEILRSLPPPDIAVAYYTGNDLYTFDDFQVSREPGSRRPPCDNLYDVFCNIRDDEKEHVSTMVACQDYSTIGERVVSPHLKYDTIIITKSSNDMNDAKDTTDSLVDNNNVTDQLPVTSRSNWKEWSAKINDEVIL